MFKQKRDRYNLLKKFANREISGSFIPNHEFHTRHAKAYELFKNIPNRCTYQLSELILLGRHVFMGTTRCGRFLLTYSYLTSPSLLTPSHEYRLHWWLHHPFKQATKVAEVKLFSDQAINNIIAIGIAQWPNVSNRLIIYGYSALNDDENMASSSSSISDLDQRRYYFTITTLPSTNDCKECKSVASSFNEEDMAANWDSCVGLSCLKHGLTMHTSFDVVYPFPSFHSSINLKLDNKIVFNSGNFLHVIFVEMENNNVRLKSCQPKDSIAPERVVHKVGKSLFFNYPKEYFLPLNVPQACQIHQTISMYQQQHQQQSTERTTRRWCNRIPNLAMKPVPTKTKAWRRTITDQAEKVYAFEEAEDGCEPKLKWYRRKRLADKMYEFCSDEEDMENIQPEGKNKLPRYKFSTPSPEKNPNNKTNCDKTDLISNNSEDNDKRLNQQIIASKLDIQQPFTKMLINQQSSKIRWTERRNCNDHKTENVQDLLSNDDNRNSCDNASQNFDKLVQSCDKSPLTCDSISISFTKACICNINTPPSSPFNNKNVILDCTDSDNSSSSFISNHTVINSPNSSDISCSETSDATVKDSASIINNKLNTQLVIKTALDDDKQDLCDNYVESNNFSDESKRETVLDIIKEWEVDSISSLSPKCETAWIPNPVDIKRHNIIQKFLEIPQRNSLKTNNYLKYYNKKQRLFDFWSLYPNKKRLSQNLIASTKLNTKKDNGHFIDTDFETGDFINGRISTTQLLSKIKVVLRPCNRNKYNSKLINCANNKQLTDPTSDDEKSIKASTTPAKEEIKPKMLNKAVKDQLNDAFGHHLIQGCSVQLDRRYIEVDEELISTITDIEDDDQSSIGFHCALPIVVHGTAYSQLQMVSNCKAGKLNMPSVFVRQNSLDIEPLCHRAADIVSNCEGYKFWSLNDYETEIINICPFNDDILFLVHMRLNVEPLIYQYKKQMMDKRDYYECRCFFIWNSELNECHLEAYTKLTNVKLINANSLCNQNNSSFTLAQREASKLRNSQNIGLFSYDLNLPVRSLDHQLYDDEYNLVETVHEIRDQANLLVITLDGPDLQENLSRRNVIELM